MKVRNVSSSGMTASQRSTEANTERQRATLPQEPPSGGTPENVYTSDDYMQQSSMAVGANPNKAKKSKKVKTAKPPKPPKVKKPLTAVRVVVRVIAGILTVGAVGVLGYWYIKVYVPPRIVTTYSMTGASGLDSLEEAMQGYSKEDIQSSLSSDVSWLSKEEAYANDNKLRISFIEAMISNVEFNYPSVQSVNSRGLMYNKVTNEPLWSDSDMSSGESTYISHVDYNSISNQMMVDRVSILKLVSDKGLKPTDYTYKEDITNLMIEYILSMKSLPMSMSEVAIPVENVPIISTDSKGRMSSVPNYVVSDDVDIDKLLFSSDDFHSMCDTFSALVSGGIPVAKMVGNEVRSMSVQTTKESIIPYTWIGAYYCQNELETGVVEEQVGDGTFEKPAHLGTTIITKSVDASGSSVDIKLTLDRYYVNKEAIDYLTQFSEKNRGFVSDSNTKLICIEYTVTNLMSSAITVSDDICLVDKNANQSAKTGNIYGLTETVTLGAGESKQLQSWSSSTELDRKYVAWGKSFKREYPVVWFYLLAGDKGFDNSVLDATDSKKTEGEDTLK